MQRIVVRSTARRFVPLLTAVAVGLAATQPARAALIGTEEAAPSAVQAERERVAASVTVESGLIEEPRRGIWLAIRITDRQGEIAFDKRFDRLWREIL